jgi:hypothetical protein
VLKSFLSFVLATVPAVCADGVFSATVYPALEAAGCRGCHSADGVASATRVRFPDEGAPATRVEAFGKSLARVGPLLLDKPTNRVAHAGGQRIKPGSAEEAALREWMKVLAAMPKSEVDAAVRSLEEAAPGQRRAMAAVRRLTNSQYNNTVRDLLGDRTAPANQFPPEDFVNGFKNQYNAQALSPLHLDAYSAAAEKLARNAFRAGAPALVKCKPSVTCRAEFVRTFGKRAFRRPLDAAEVSRYTRLFTKEKDFRGGAQLVVEAMLQSPGFLFRLDETGNPKWRPYAAASRLSYALWDTMPDEALMAAAERGELSTRAGVEKAARRMLEDARARQALDEFVSQWMRFDRVLGATKDRRKFPNFTAETAAAMTREMRTFVGELVWRDRNFTELLTADYGFPNGDLAALYGVTQKGADFEQVKFPAESERAGLLGQALFLSLTSKPDETSPTARGLFVREQLLCQHVPDPPPGVDTNLPALSEAKPQSTRDRLAEHTTNKSCAGCHNLIDPIGFGFEKFDAVGARREKLKLQFGRERRSEGMGKTVEVELNTSGQVAGIANSAFASPRDLGTILANSPQCQECFVKQYFRYVTGRTEGPADRPLLKQVYERFRDSGFRFRELIISLVSSLEFPGEGARVHVASHY